MHTTDDLRVSILQLPLYWEAPKENCAAIGRLLEGLETDVLVLPEMFSTGFSMNPDKLAEEPGGSAFCWMREQARRGNMAITGSLMIRDRGHFYNRLIWMNPDGTFYIYNKRHLFSLAGEEKIYTAGNEKLIVSYKGWQIRPLICYDLRFPVWCRNKADYDLLLFVANWPEKRAYAWRQLLLARAIENQSYVVGVNRTGADGNGIMHSGNSMVIDEMGEIIEEIPPHETGLRTAVLSKSALQHTRQRFAFLDDRDDFEITGQGFSLDSR